MLESTSLAVNKALLFSIVFILVLAACSSSSVNLEEGCYAEKSTNYTRNK